MQEIPEIFFDDVYSYFFPTKSDEQTIQEATFIEKVLKLNKGDNVLDLCCGSGRHANILAQRGYKITGIDVSGKLLEIAREQAKHMSVDPLYIEQDVRRMDFNSEFDASYNVYTSFGYFPDEENELILKNVYKALKEGGRFLLDTRNREYIIKNSPHVNTVTEKDGNYLIEMTDFDHLQSRLNMH